MQFDLYTHNQKQWSCQQLWSILSNYLDQSLNRPLTVWNNLYGLQVQSAVSILFLFLFWHDIKDVNWQTICLNEWPVKAM